MSRWEESFAIFGRHGLGDHDVFAEHDVIYVHCPRILSNSEDGKRLQELGWGKDEDSGIEQETDPYYELNEDESWYHYV